MGPRAKGKKKMINNVRRARPIKREEGDQVERIPEWVIQMNNSLKEGPDYDSGRSWTIYRVPASMQEIHKKSYIPKIISIGPFHYGDQLLQVMEEHKMRFLLRLLGGRFQENNGQEQVEELEHQVEGGQISDNHLAPKVVTTHKAGVKLEELAGAMRALEHKTRQCYSEAFDGINSDDFVQMMVVDGCFVVELLRLYYKFDKEVSKHSHSGRPPLVEDPIFTTRWMLRTLQRDLLMLENQLPFFVLQELFNLTCPSKDSTSLIDLTFTFFDPLLPRKDLPESNPDAEIDHMLDAFRSTYLTSVKEKMTQLRTNSNITLAQKRQAEWIHSRTKSNISLAQEKQLIHCVQELQEAGVEFKMKNGFNNLLDIDFKDGVLEIPPLYIDDNTVPLFLNFVAYEQCDEEAEPFFTNYFIFFDSLINSSKDVEILHKNGIINHVLGSDKDVANLFNKFGREIVYDLDQCYLSKQMKGVNEYCKAYFDSQWHVWLSNLVRDYFSSPWTCLSLLAAITLLVLTTLQTFFTLFPYYHPARNLN